MGGSNPYIEQAKFVLPTKKFKVTFVREGKTVEVDPEKLPYGHDGLPGSILDIAYLCARSLSTDGAAAGPPDCIQRSG